MAAPSAGETKICFLQKVQSSSRWGHFDIYATNALVILKNDSFAVTKSEASSFNTIAVGHLFSHGHIIHTDFLSLATMSMALQAFQYKRKLNKAIKDVKNEAENLMGGGKKKEPQKQESLSWMNSFKGKKKDPPVKKEEQSQQKSFLPWQNKNAETEEAVQESSSLQDATDASGKTAEMEGDSTKKEKKSRKQKSFFKRRHSKAEEIEQSTSQNSPTLSKNDAEAGTTQDVLKKEKKKANSYDDDDWWMDDSDSEDESQLQVSSHDKKEALDDEPKYHPKTEAEYAKTSGGSSWWE